MPARKLPARRNSLMVEDHAPAYEILVERRCLGQTELKVKPGQVGTSNATKPDNLGTLDYAHLRVPLPKDLTDSGIFQKQPNRKWPESYFLMRRSTDGYISATGMFKAAFPWAQQEEEAAEKDFLKDLDGTSGEEIAGNVWIQPEQALALADEYGIRVWILALLDPEPITHGTSDPTKEIKSPPTYRMKSAPNGTAKSPSEKKADGKKSVRGTARGARSESPVKKTPARKMATPRKPRKGRGKADDDAADVDGDAAATQFDSQQDKVRVEVETTATPAIDGGEDVETTKLNIEMPAGHPDLELPNDAEGMLAKAREMVDQAEKIAGPSTAKGKRKASDMIVSDDEVGLEGPIADTKRAKTVQLELRKERIKRRALTGIAASLAIGALVPSIMAAFGA